ncbi:MAG: hypothetical protein AAF468_22285 [Pseudomonadota bacterium]
MTMEPYSPIPARADYPVTLSKHQKGALKLIRKAKLYRTRGGWQGRGTGKITLATYNVLRMANLITINTRGFHESLVLTEQGKQFLKDLRK